MAEQQREAFEAGWKAYCEAPTARDMGRSKVEAAIRAALSHAEGEAGEVWAYADEAGERVIPALVKQESERSGGASASATKAYCIPLVRPSSAPQVAVPEGWKLVPVEPTDDQFAAALHAQGDQINYDVVYAAMLAAAPTAPAGELVTRCTAGLGCDEKGYCDAAATGQGDLCDRRTMAHEQPVSDPDGLPEPPRGAAHNARVLVDQIENGPYETISTYYEWQQLRRCLVAMEEYIEHAPDEREIAALLERIVPRIDPQNPKPLDKSEHCCECTLYYERERIHGEIARLRKLGGNHD
jgi:hypothetical protein